MTAVQQLGRRGMQQGMYTKALDIAKNMLSKRLAAHLIQDLARRN